jgi:single-strand DNA-binding protein
MTVNKCILIGNLGKDAEIRATGGGTTIANLRLATTDRRKAQDGTWEDHTEWHSVIAFGKIADVMERFGKKGKMLYIEGRLQTREYTDKDGNKRWSTEVVANEIRLLGGVREDGAGRQEAQDRGGFGSRGGGSDRGGSGGGGGARGNTGREEAPSGGGYDDDVIPF